MALIKGNNGVQEQVNNTAYTDEQQREMKLGLIIAKARRGWRILSLILFVIYSVVGCIQAVGTDTSFINIIVISAVGCAIQYVIVLYIFLYMLAGRTIQFFLWLRDLFGGSKNTRL